jgi:hypothetical protein
VWNAESQASCIAAKSSHQWQSWVNLPNFDVSVRSAYAPKAAVIADIGLGRDAPNGDICAATNCSLLDHFVGEVVGEEERRGVYVRPSPRSRVGTYTARRPTAVEPYTVKTGTPAAFFSDVGGRDIQKFLIEYVANFVTDAAGKRFNPHVTIGVGTEPI